MGADCSNFTSFHFYLICLLPILGWGAEPLHWVVALLHCLLYTGLGDNKYKYKYKTNSNTNEEKLINIRNGEPTSRSWSSKTRWLLLPLFPSQNEIFNCLVKVFHLIWLKTSVLLCFLVHEGHCDGRKNSKTCCSQLFESLPGNTLWSISSCSSLSRSPLWWVCRPSWRKSNTGCPPWGARQSRSYIGKKKEHWGGIVLERDTKIKCWM